MDDVSAIVQLHSSIDVLIPCTIECLDGRSHRSHTSVTRMRTMNASKYACHCSETRRISIETFSKGSTELGGGCATRKRSPRTSRRTTLGRYAHDDPRLCARMVKRAKQAEFRVNEIDDQTSTNTQHVRHGRRFSRDSARHSLSFPLERHYGARWWGRLKVRAGAAELAPLLVALKCTSETLSTEPA